MRPSGSVAAEEPAPREEVSAQRVRTARPARSRRLMWILLAIALLALPFLSLPGRYVADTRDALWLDPGAYLGGVFGLWRNSPYLGDAQAVGLFFPMGVVVWLLHALGLSVWVAERLWHGLLLLTAAGATILLVDRMRGRRTVLTPLVAGLLYAMTPFTFGFGLTYSAAFLPYALLPLLLLITLRGAEEGGLLWPVAFGLTVVAMGGGNAPQVCAVATALLFALWLALADRGVRAGRVWRFTGLALLTAVGLNVYWLALLPLQGVSTGLSTSVGPGVPGWSLSETVRGLGAWQLAGGHLGPAAAPVRPYVAQPLLVAAGFAVPVLALISAWRVRWRFRLFFLLLGIAAAFVVTGAFPASNPTPFGALLKWLSDHTGGSETNALAVGAMAALNLSLAVLVGIAAEPAVQALGRLRYATVFRAVALVAVAVLVAINALPLLSGNAYDERLSLRSIPAYWTSALARLRQEAGSERIYFAPGTNAAIYRWGTVRDGMAAATLTPGAIEPDAFGFGSAYTANILRAAEQPYVGGTGASGAARLLRYLGAGNVVLQNDLDWQRARTARPADLHVLLRNPDIRREIGFGQPGQNTTAPLPRGVPTDPRRAFEERLAPVEILSVRNPVQPVRAEGPDPVIVSGDGFGIAEAANAGLLSSAQPILYSGLLKPGDLTALMTGSNPTLIVTDSNRRRVWSFATPSGMYSSTLPANAGAGSDAPASSSRQAIAFGLFDGRLDTQSVAVYPGLASIAASAYGSPLRLTPQFRPANAFDGDPHSWWVVGPDRNPVGAWIRATFDAPRTLGSMSITTPAAGAGPRVRSVEIDFSDGSAIDRRLRPQGVTGIRFPARTTSWIQVRIASAVRGTLPRPRGVAIADIGVPGLAAAELIQIPTDMFAIAAKAKGGVGGLAGLPLTYLFERARTGASRDRDEELRIARRFEVPTTRSFALAGAAHLNRLAADQQIDALAYGDQPVTVSSSSRLFNLPALRGSAAFDGDPSTGWIPSGRIGQWVQADFPPHQIDSIVVHVDTSHLRTPILKLRARFADGSTVDGRLQNLSDGTIKMSFPPVVTSSVRLTIESVFLPSGSKPKPSEITEVEIPDVPAVAADGKAPLPCASGDDFTVDGHPVPVRLQGTQGDLIRGRNLPLATCDGSQISLNAGTHDLVGGGALQPDAVSLASAGGVLSQPAQLPSTSASSPVAGRYVIDVHGATSPYYLVLGQSDVPGWHASIDGTDLGPPVLLDGYSAGWYVTKTGSYTVTATFGPQTVYTAGLVVSGAVLVGLALLIVLVLARERRRRRAS